MSVRHRRLILLGSLALIAACCLAGGARSQTPAENPPAPAPSPGPGPAPNPRHIRSGAPPLQRRDRQPRQHRRQRRLRARSNRPAATLTIPPVNITAPRPRGARAGTGGPRCGTCSIPRRPPPRRPLRPAHLPPFRAHGPALRAARHHHQRPDPANPEHELRQPVFHNARCHSAGLGPAPAGRSCAD